jgi:predicted dienelactone hydrolase
MERPRKTLELAWLQHPPEAVKAQPVVDIWMQDKKQKKKRNHQMTEHAPSPLRGIG